MSTNQEKQHTTGHPTFMQYVVVAIILFAITIVEFVLIWERAGIDEHLGESKIPLLIFLSAIKFAIVIMFYMHLKFEARLFSGIFLAGLALSFIVGIALLGLFVGFGGEPRDFAKTRAVPFAHAETAAGHAAPGPAAVNTLHMGVVGDALQFDTTTSTVSAGSEVVLTFANVSTANQHNWVLVETGTKDDVADDGTLAGPDNEWIQPDDPRVLFHTELLDPGESEEIRFTVEAGSYQFVCTFPGHSLTMFGDFEAVAGDPQTAALSGPSGLTVGVEGDALQFDALNVTAKAGEVVSLTFNNESTVNQHNWVVVRDGTKDDVAARGITHPTADWLEPNDPDVIANTKLLGPETTGEVNFIAPPAGTYQFVCTFPGHNITMFGTFEVDP